jgi:MscS family membrane protein
VPFDTPAERLLAFRDGIQELIRQHPGVRYEKQEVALNDLGITGVEILVQAFFDVSGSREELIARDGLILEILRLADCLGIQFAKVGRPASG